MDFNKFSEAGRNIKLTENKKREIVNACRNCGIDRHKPVSPNFKRTVAAICALTIVLMAGVVLTKHIGNGRQISVGETDTSTVFSESTVSDIVHSEKSSETTTTKDLPVIENGTSVEGDGGGNISTRKYRVNYYDVPYQFLVLVGEDVYWEWDEQYNNDNPDETNVMVMKKFVEYFNISRESFDKANLEWAKVILNKMGSQPNMNPKDFANQETDEVYNADIIFTFDDKIINDYYLSGYYPYIYESEYEKAVANGEYVSQTTDWIDIEQMEAEIIAKYGET